MQSCILSFRLNRFGSFNTLHFVASSIGSRVVSCCCQKTLNIIRSSDKCLCRLLHKMLEVLHSLLLKIYPFYIKKCFYNDGDNRLRILYVCTSGFLPYFKVSQIIHNNPWSWPFNNVFRKAADYNCLHNIWLLNDYPN